MTTYEVLINGEKVFFKSKRDTFTHVVCHVDGVILNKCSGKKAAESAKKGCAKYGNPNAYIVEVKKI